GRALQHIPAILLAGGEELDEPIPIDLLVRLLDHDDAETVAAAACALVELETEGVGQALAPVQGGDRLLAPDGAPPPGRPDPGGGGGLRARGARDRGRRAGARAIPRG